MSGNSFGTLYCVTSFGESHGPAYGGVVDGCPPGLALSAEDLQKEVAEYNRQIEQTIEQGAAPEPKKPGRP